MKRTYYNQLTEAYTKNLMFIDKPDSIEKVEANIEFLKEASRLPLYASQDMVEFIENMKNPEKSKETGIEEFYIIMRNDLCSDKFIKFDNLIDISISIPNKVLITDLKGDKKIQEIQKNPH